MPFKISFSMTWLIWLSHCIIFQIRKRNNELTYYQICCLLFVFVFSTYQKVMLFSNWGQNIFEDLQASRPRPRTWASIPRPRTWNNVSLRTSLSPRTSSRTPPLVKIFRCLLDRGSTKVRKVAETFYHFNNKIYLFWWWFVLTIYHFDRRGARIFLSFIWCKYQVQERKFNFCT